MGSERIVDSIYCICNEMKNKHEYEQELENLEKEHGELLQSISYERLAGNCMLQTVKRFRQNIAERDEICRKLSIIGMVEKELGGRMTALAAGLVGKQKVA